MLCTLLVPDLFWPADTADDAGRGLDLAALETALARARPERHPPIAREGWLCQAFEVERQQDWPVAPLTLALDGGDPGTAYWLRADPVHLQLQRDRVALMAGATLDVTRREADDIVAALNAQFAADGLRFAAPTPQRWYLRASQPPALLTETLGCAAGRDVHDVLPKGGDASTWRQAFNEIQMVLHALPLNADRVDAGRPAINSVWIWGGGVMPDVPGRTFTAVWSDDALAQALGAHADAHAAALPADAAAWMHAAGALRPQQNHLIVYDACSNAAAYGDVAGWRSAMAELERAWLQPLVAALRTGVIQKLAIVAPCPAASWRFEIGARSLYKFWVARRPLAAYWA